jgi:HAMP domain-containing protein
MLRRKLILNLCPLVALLLLTGIFAIYLLQGVLEDIRHINSQAWRLVEDVNELSIVVNTIQSDLYELQLNRESHLDQLIRDVETAQGLVDGLDRYYVLQQPEAARLHEEIVRTMPQFARHVSALATAQDPELSVRHNEQALMAAVAMRQDTLPLSRYVRDHAHEEQESLASWLRWVVLGLAVVFLVLINASIAILMRMAVLILRPVDKLVEATQELRQERFDTRVELDENDEFDQLAQAYNRLAEHLQANERRRMEVMGQVALAMNHELNNAIAIIDLQLQLLSRRTGGDLALEKCLREINQSLRRMTRAVQNLRNVRRIVLTDYVPGIKMLDLERSVSDAEHGPEGQPQTNGTEVPAEA